MFYKSALLLRDFLLYASAGTSYGPVFDCVCVCLSVCHNRSSIETAEWIELVFGTGAAFHLSYSVLKWNSGIFKNNGTSPWNFVQNSGLRKLSFRISIVETCYRLLSARWTLRAW